MKKKIYVLYLLPGKFQSEKKHIFVKYLKAELIHTVGIPAYLLNGCHDDMLNRLFHHHYGLDVF